MVETAMLALAVLIAFALLRRFALEHRARLAGWGASKGPPSPPHAR